MLAVPYAGYDTLSVSFFEISSTGCGKESDRNTGMHEHAVLYVQGVHHRGRREAQALGPGKRVIEDRFFAHGRCGPPPRLPRGTLLLVPLSTVVW